MRLSMLRGNNVILIGFMGCGKTVVGRALARKLGWRYVDVDRMVERQTGRSIHGLFHARGEPYFRDREHRAIRGLIRFSRRVIAAGGGAPVFSRNRRWLWRAGHVVYLKVPIKVLVARLQGAGDRPLLARTSRDPRALHRQITRLVRKRDKYYAKADLTVRTGSLSPARAAQRVLRLLKPFLRRVLSPVRP